MPFNGSGTASPPNPPTFPAVSGQTIEAAKFNATINDIYASLTQCIVKDGQTVITGVLQWADKPANLAALGAVSLAATQVIDGVKTFSSPPKSAVAASDAADLVRKGDLDTLMLSLFPAGSVWMFAMGTVQPGWLEMDGSIKKRADYPRLFAAIGTTYNTGGEAADEFRLPESRGEFPRGWDHGRGVDAGRALGSYQLDASQKITGTLGGAVQYRAGTVPATGAFSNVSGGPNGNDNAGGDPSRFVDFDSSRVVRTAAETRPRNLALMFCIKT